MKVQYITWLASRNLSRHAFRSFLTILGIIFGVGSLVSMLAIAEGARRKSLENVTSLAIDNVIIESTKPQGSSSGETDSQEDMEENSNYLKYGLKQTDRQSFKFFENVTSVAGIRDTRKIIYQNGKKTNISTLAVEPEFLNIGKVKILKGRFINSTDLFSHQSICVIGKNAAEKLFPNRDPLEYDLNIGNVWYQIVGVIQIPTTLKLGFNANLNNTVYLPYSTALVRYGTAAKLSQNEIVDVTYDALILQIKNLDFIENTAKRVEAFLKATHDLLDYTIQVPYDLVKQKENSAKIFSIVMGTIASISLLVGGIGVMNIMMANVYERTREIGISLATGARQQDILLQFLLEALVLSLVGGILGLLLGVGLSHIVANWADWQTAVTPVALIGSLVISAGVGLLSGTYPAYKASRLSPIEALSTR